ncbi:MAG: hypothetical protein ACKOZU_01550 [Planctomycetaceae bacterium]
MSVRQTALAGLPPWIGMGSLVPVAGLLVMVSLAVADDRTPENWRPPAGHNTAPEVDDSASD